MGHERIGSLPRSKRWRDVVADLSDPWQSPSTTASIAARTLENVRDRLKGIESDPGVHAAFQFIVALTHSARTGEPQLGGAASVAEGESTIRIAQGLATWVDDHRGSAEYGALAKAAAGDAIARWTTTEEQQGNLFSADPSRIAWVSAGTGAGFSEVARLFFASFSERYLKYFLDREASANARSLDDRNRLDADIRQHVDRISAHAFETAKITQSFAAGWFNRYAKGAVPDDRQIGRFLRIAFGKLREELLREQRQE